MTEKENNEELRQQLICELKEVKQQRAEEDQELAELKQQLPELKQQLPELRQQNQQSTLRELLIGTHHFFDKFRISANAELTTQANNTSVKVRPIPHHIRLSNGLRERRTQALERFEDALQQSDGTSDRLFTSAAGRQGVKEFLGPETICSEGQLTSFYDIAVGSSLSLIINDMAKQHKYKNALHLRPRTGFDAPDYPIEEKLISELPREYDRYCFVYDESKATCIFVINHKAPHQLTVPILTIGLEGIDKVDLKQFIRDSELTNDAGPEVYARKLVLNALCQTYDYMLAAGTLFGCFVTGQRTVLLEISEADPFTLNYNFTVAREDVERADDYNKHRVTDVGQLLGLYLIASNSCPQPLDWRQHAREQAYEWTNSGKQILGHLPEEDRKPNDSLSDDDKWSSTGTKARPLKKQGQKALCNPSAAHETLRRPNNDSEDNDQPRKDPKYEGAESVLRPNCQ